MLRREDADLGHANARLPGQFFHGGQKPLLFPVPRRGEDLRPRALLRHEFAEQEGYEGAAHAKDCAEGEQGAGVQVDAVGGEDAAHSEKIQGDAGEHHHGEVGPQKEGDPLHSIALQGVGKEKDGSGAREVQGAGDDSCEAPALDGAPGPS